MKPARSRFIPWAGLVVGVALVVAIVGASIRAGKSGAGQLRQLPDGSDLKLLKVAFTNSYGYMHQSGPPILRAIASILPRPIRSRFNVGSSGSFGFGGDGNTNLFVITANRATTRSAPTWSSSLQRLRVADEQGNSFDACWGANTLGLPGETIHGWQIRAFPRRTPHLIFEFIAPGPGASSPSTVASVQVRNPAFDTYPQWSPEPWPKSKPLGNLAVTLKEFQSGDCISGRGSPTEPASPRKTHLRFTFAENGRPSEDWRVQKLTISDATGNQWFPYLDLIGQGLNWARGGTVEFLGALWPGEDAWKLKAEVVRSGGFQPDDLWEIPITLPAPGTLSGLTNSWRKHNLTLRLVAIASPNTDHSGDFKWIAKWWGADKSQVYSLGLKVDGKLDGARVIVVRAVGRADDPVKIVEHGSQDYPNQAIFLKPVVGTGSIRLTLTVQKSRFVEFLARPEFVEPSRSEKAAPVEKR